MDTTPISTPTSPSSESNITKQKQPDMTNTRTVEIPPPPFINSINELRSLSTALSAFLRRYDDLNDHLNSIKSAIDSKLPNHLLSTANPNQSTLTPLIEASCDHAIISVSEQNPNGTASHCERIHELVTKPRSPNFSKKPEETDTSKKPEETDNSKKPEETDNSKKPEDIDISKPAVTELERYCETMCGREMKRYVISHISDMNKLREEIPKALKLAKDPAKLVLDSVGRFFITGSRAYSKNKQLVVVRLASVVILECFVMISSDGIEIAKEDEEYAAQAAVDWRKRMIHESALRKTEEVDARGLLLLISGFGIPDGVFKNDDIRDLIRASNVKEISIALRRSIILIPKIPEVINWMVKNNLEVEAADIAYTFGLEDKCHPQTILTTFLHNTIKDTQHGSSAQMKEATKKQLSDLKSIRKCLETHKVDPTKLFPDFKINEKIQQLEKVIKSAQQMITQKRKAKEAESSRTSKHQDPKRTRLSSHDNMPRHQTAVHSTSSVLHASVPPGNTGGMLPGSYGTSVYRGAYSDQMVNTTDGPPYAWHEDSVLIEKYLGQPYLRQGQPYDSQPSAGLIGLYGGPSERSSLDPFPGLPSSGFSARGGGAGSDLYSFADKVATNESYQGPRASGSGTRRSSYLY